MGINSSKICGQIRGYTLYYAYNYGFDVNYYYGMNVDDHYVEGISITQGTQGQHVWTFAAGDSEDDTHYDARPCNNGCRYPTVPFICWK